MEFPLANLATLMIVLLVMAMFERSRAPRRPKEPPAPPPDPWGTAMESAIRAATTGDFARGVEHARHAVRLLRESPADERRLILSLTRLGSLELRSGQIEAARVTIGRLESLERSGVLPLLSHAGSDLHEMLGELAQADGRRPVAESHYRAAVRIEERLCGPRTSNLQNALRELARLLRERDAWGPARRAYQRLLDLEIAEPAAAATHRCEVLVEMAGLQLVQGDAEGAASLVAEALAVAEETTCNPRSRWKALLCRTEVLLRQRRLDEAEAGVREIVELERGRLPSPALLHPLEQLARVLTLQGNLAEAAAIREELLELGSRFFGGESPGLAYQLEELADLSVRRDDLDAALPYLERATRLAWQARGPLDWKLPDLLQKQAALVGRGECGLQAEEYHRMAERIGGRLRQRHRQN